MKRLTVLGVCVVLVVGCSGKKPPVAELPPPDVTASPVYLNDKEIDYDTFEGRIAAISTVEVRMRANGYLQKFNFTEGSEVKGGTLLFQLDPVDYKIKLEIAEQQFNSYKARVDRLNEDFDRVERLRPGGGISREEYDKVKGDRNEALAAKEAAAANVNKAKQDLSYCTYNAPVTDPPGGSWRVDRVQVTPGNLILADTTVLTTLVSTGSVYVNFDVDERTLLEYQRSTRANADGRPDGVPLKDLKIPCEIGLDTDQGHPHKGMLDFSASKLDPTTGTYPVRGILDNASRIFTPGLRARVRVASGKPYKAILVNERAVLTDQTRRFVYVVKDGQPSTDDPAVKVGTAHRVDVQLGSTHGELVVVKNGLSAGDLVVVNNIQRVRPQGKVKFKEEMMPGTGK